MTVVVRVGTSGYDYPEWKGRFYPRDLPASRRLAYYAERLGTVEINATFRRAPTPEGVKGWAARTPPGFVFALKAPQRITHMRRLRDVEEPLRDFCTTARQGRTPDEATASWGYYRLRNVDYSAAQLGRWAGALTRPGRREVFCYFKHEDTGTGPLLAARLLARLGRRSISGT
jgi:uncharacterized protein YecE (DUF72 family)